MISSAITSDGATVDMKRSNEQPIVWEDGATSVLRCYACGAVSPCAKVLSVRNLRDKSTSMALHECPGCHSYFYDPLPDTNYTDGYPQGIARYHLLQGASLEFALEALSALPNKNGRLLDVGCGPGLIVDLWERMELGDATGIEPSPVGKFAMESLHRRIRPLHLDEDKETPDHAFDIVLSTEVIEHVAEPAEFLRALSKKVAPGGALLFSTPNIGSLRSGGPSASNLMEALSPGFHVTLFSAEALRRLLAEAGWNHVHLASSDDHWIVHATRSPLEPAPDLLWVERMHREYLERACGDESLSPEVRVIFAYRLFRKAANAGDWAQADMLLPQLGPLLPSSLARCLEPGVPVQAEEFFGPVPPEALGSHLHLPALLFLLGMRERNHLGDSARAILLFKLAAHLARQATLHLLDDAYTKEIYWAARLNAAAALLDGGDEPAGMEILEAMAFSLEPESTEQARLLPQLKFATRARLAMFQHLVQRGNWESAAMRLPALHGWLASHYPSSLLRPSGWNGEPAAWPEEWNPFWYFYCESMLMLHLGRNADAQRGFAGLHALCASVPSHPDARHFLPLSTEHEELARSRIEPIPAPVVQPEPIPDLPPPLPTAVPQGLFERLRRRLLGV